MLQNTIKKNLDDYFKPYVPTLVGCGLREGNNSKCCLPPADVILMAQFNTEV